MGDSTAPTDSAERPISVLNEGTEPLTVRELEVLNLIAAGRSNRAICDHLYLSPKTVESHIRRVFWKLGLQDTPEDNRRVLAALAFREG